MLRFFRDSIKPFSVWAMWSKNDGTHFGTSVYGRSIYSIVELKRCYSEINLDQARAILADRPQELRDELERLVREHGNCPETPKSSPPLPANGDGWDKPSPLIDDPIDAATKRALSPELVKRIKRLAQALIDMNITLCKYNAEDPNLTPLQAEALRAAYMDEQVNACIVFQDMNALAIVNE